MEDMAGDGQVGVRGGVNFCTHLLFAPPCLFFFLLSSLSLSSARPGLLRIRSSIERVDVSVGERTAAAAERREVR